VFVIRFFDRKDKREKIFVLWFLGKY
jgi:hypothetical protein